MWKMRGAWLGGLVVLAVTMVGCDDAPTAAGPDPSPSLFPTVDQGFEDDTKGWFGAARAGGDGFCGSVTRQSGDEAVIAASDGDRFALIAAGGCNDFWTQRGAQGGAPWAPGPDFAFFSTEWPASGGYVTELDIYLDPAWTAPEGAPVFIFTSSIRDLDSPADQDGEFRYFFVPVVGDGEALTIFEARIWEPGWYTFRHVFTDGGGRLRVRFELSDRNGANLVALPFEEAIDFVIMGAPPPVPVPVSVAEIAPAEFGSGYLWFVTIAPGVEIPIDRHRLFRIQAVE